MTKRILVAIVAFIGGLAAALPARADGVATGQVEWVSAATLVYKDHFGVEGRIQVDAHARVTHNGRPILLDQLRPGSMVTIFWVDGPYAPFAIAVDATGAFMPPNDANKQRRIFESFGKKAG